MKLSIVTSFGASKFSLEETIKLIGKLGYEVVDITTFLPHADPDAIDEERRRQVKEQSPLTS